MRKFYFLAGVAVLILAAASCSPSIYRMDLQMRQPSLSGYDFGGKELAVVYVADGADSVYAKSVAEGFAASLDDDYFDGGKAVGIYSMPAVQGADYSSRDTLLNLVMDTGKDAIFLLEGKPVDNNRLLDLRLSVYDSMAGIDTVRVFSGYRMISDGRSIGTKAASQFLSAWSPESYYFYYYESGAWLAAAVDAHDFKWYSALQKWLGIAESAKGTRLGYVSLNIANTCYILGDYALCQRWLAIAEKEPEVTYASSLRKKLTRRLGR